MKSKSAKLVRLEVEKAKHLARIAELVADLDARACRVEKLEPRLERVEAEAALLEEKLAAARDEVAEIVESAPTIVAARAAGLVANPDRVLELARALEQAAYAAMSGRAAS